jgi:WD40 repeat protein
MDCSDAAPGLVVAAAPNLVAVLSAGRPRRALAVPTAPDIRRVAVSTTAQVVAVARDTSIQLVDVATGNVVREWPTPSPAQRLTFSLDDRFLVTAHADNVARLWLLPGAGRPEDAGPAGTTEWRYDQEPISNDFYTLTDTVATTPM